MPWARPPWRWGSNHPEASAAGAGVAAPPPHPFQELWERRPQLDPHPAKSPRGSEAVFPDLPEPPPSAVCQWQDLRALGETKPKEATPSVTAYNTHCCGLLQSRAAQSLLANIPPPPHNLEGQSHRLGGLRRHWAASQQTCRPPGVGTGAGVSIARVTQNPRPWKGLFSRQKKNQPKSSSLRYLRAPRKYRPPSCPLAGGFVRGFLLGALGSVWRR